MAARDKRILREKVRYWDPTKRVTGIFPASDEKVRASGAMRA